MVTLKKWLHQMGLWPRMALGISLGFLLLFSAFIALGERAVQESVDRILEERLIIAEMAAAQLDGILEQATNELQQARRFADFDPGGEDLSAESHMLAHTYGRVGTFESGIIFADSKGTVVLAHPADIYSRGDDLSEQSHIASALEKKAVTISSPSRDPLNGRPVVAVTVPIFGQDRFLALIIGLVDLNSETIVAPLRQAASMGQTGHAVLVDGRGRTLASTFGSPFLSPSDHVAFYREAMRENQSVVDQVPLEIEHRPDTAVAEHLMAFSPLANVPWGVAVGGDVDEIYSGVAELRLGLVILGVLAFGTTWAATLLGTRRLVQPVKELTNAAQQIADQKLETPLQIAEGGEIGAMAEALERMRRILLHSINELADVNATLEARVEKRTAALREHQELVHELLRRAINAQEEERARISRELHDEIGQTLTAVQLSLDRLARPGRGGEVEARERVEKARTLTEKAMDDLRRVIAALRPGVLDELGLVPALNWMADHTLRPSDVDVSVEAQGLVNRLPAETETLLFRVAQEAMNNVARHSRAERLSIRLEYHDGQVEMELEDDGQGFDPQALPSGGEGQRGLGLASMQERASLAGGTASIVSAPGEGTVIKVVLPVTSAEG